MSDLVTIAILAKDKAHCLPLYLSCLLGQTFSKEQTCLYIRTNDNTDATTEILQQWIDHHGSKYREVYFDASSIDSNLKLHSPHEWTQRRFAILGSIRQESVDWARHRNSHYFVADCDNFIHPQTIEILLRTQLPVVGPFLVTGTTTYSNYHHRVTQDGYCLDEPGYHLIHQQRIKGLIQVDVIHCTYMIRRDLLEKITYLFDGTGRHEYVIFSEHLRRNGIPQYIDNRCVYGRITFADTKEDLIKESWMKEFQSIENIIGK